MSYLPVPNIFAGRSGNIRLQLLDDDLAYVSAKRLSVKDFGAKVDGVTDDAVAVQAAADYAVANGLELTFPSGTCICNSTITFTGGPWSISGDGPTSIVKTTNANIALFTFNINGSTNVNGWRIFGLLFQGPITANAASCALRFIGNAVSLIQFGYCNVDCANFNAFVKDEKTARVTGFGLEGMLNWNRWDVRAIGQQSTCFWATQGSGTGNIFSGVYIPQNGGSSCFFFDGVGCVVGDVVFTAAQFGCFAAGGIGVKIGDNTVYRAQWDFSGVDMDANCDIPILASAVGANGYTNWLIDGTNWGGNTLLGPNLQPLTNSVVIDRDVSDWKAGVAKVSNVIGAATVNCFTINFGTYGAAIFDVYVGGVISGIGPSASYYQFQIRSNAGVVTVVANTSTPGTANGFTVTTSTGAASATLTIGFTSGATGTAFNATVRASGNDFKISRI